MPKPLKVPSLARSVPNLLSIFALNLLWNRLRSQPSPFSSHVINSSGFPGESQLVLTDGWMDGWSANHVFIMFFGNISKNTHFFGLTVFGPLRRLFKTSFVKNSKVLKNFIYFLNFRTIFFFRDFFEKKSCFSVISQKIFIFFF